MNATAIIFDTEATGLDDEREVIELAYACNAFEERVAMIPEAGCWLWLGQIKPNGYGRWYIGGIRERYAHRLSWMIYKGSIPNGLRVLHRCDMPCCVNPSHLFIGTAADNTQDMMRKGRDRHNPNVRGESNPRAKLTLKQVAEIRTSSLPGTVLGPSYGVSSSMIYYIKKNLSWRESNPCSR